MDIRIPNGLIFNQATLCLAKSAGSKYVPGVLESLDFHARRAILAELHSIQQRYGTWTLVEIQSADGEEVVITI